MQPPCEPEKALDELAGYLRNSPNILIITGAGISAESGLPTYRGIGGLYEDRLTAENLEIEEVLSGEMIRQNPRLTWTYIMEIEKACRGAKFNRAHRVIAEMEQRFERVWVLTQNIDGFHRDAGSRNVLDIHGDIHDLYCPDCEYRERVVDFSHLSLPPRCPACGAVIRPDVILFGEFLDQAKVARLRIEMHRGFDLVISIGTTSVFPYISGPVHEARIRGIPAIEINPGMTEVSAQVSLKLTATAGEALTAAWERLKKA